MSFPFLDFERLHAVERVKFIEIDGRVFAYNVKDSYLVRVGNFKAFSSEIVKTPSNPVKTLILHTTYECNLRCRHCYIDDGLKRSDEMSSKELSRIVREFGEIGGLGVDLSGGEALLKEGIEEVIQIARNQRLRTVKGLEKIAEAGIEVSLTTLITPESIPQLTDFPEFMARYGGRHWSLVMPRPSGRFSGEEEKIEKTYKLWEEARNNGLLSELQVKSHQYNICICLAKTQILY